METATVVNALRYRSTYAVAESLAVNSVIERDSLYSLIKHQNYTKSTGLTALSWLVKYGYATLEREVPGKNSGGDLLTWVGGALMPHPSYRGATLEVPLDKVGYSRTGKPLVLGPERPGQPSEPTGSQDTLHVVTRQAGTLVSGKVQALLLRDSDGRLWRATPFAL